MIYICHRPKYDSEYMCLFGRFEYLENAETADGGVL